MEILAAVFVTCIFIMVGSIYLYNRSENTAFHELLGQYKVAKGENDILKTRVKSLEEAFEFRDKKMKEVMDRLSCAEGKITEFKVDVDAVQDHCAKIREQQINLKEQLSNKRPVLRLEGPVPVQVVDKIKRQLKGLSK